MITRRNKKIIFCFLLSPWFYMVLLSGIFLREARADWCTDGNYTADEPCSVPGRPADCIGPMSCATDSPGLYCSFEFDFSGPTSISDPNCCTYGGCPEGNRDLCNDGCTREYLKGTETLGGMTYYCVCTEVTCSACPGDGGDGDGDGCSSCSVVNLQCPQYALVGSPFNISVEFQRGDSDYEGRSVWGPVYYPGYPEQCFWFFGWFCLPAQPAYIDYEELWCNEGDPTSECSWYSETPSVNCPTQPGTYTYDIGCGGYEEGDYYCGQTNQPSTKASCDVQCVATLPTHLLTVTRQGTGSGTITSNPAGVNCGSDCSETYSYGTQVTLTASPSAGSTFAGWSGACSGAFSSCTLTVDNNKTVTATFQATSIGHVRIQGTSGLIKLNLISVADAIAALKGVIKIALPGGTIGSADLVETSDTAASPVRMMTPYGVKSWREAP